MVAAIIISHFNINSPFIERIKVRRGEKKRYTHSSFIDSSSNNDALLCDDDDDDGPCKSCRAGTGDGFWLVHFSRCSDSVRMRKEKSN